MILMLIFRLTVNAVAELEPSSGPATSIIVADRGSVWEYSLYRVLRAYPAVLQLFGSSRRLISSAIWPAE